MREPPIWRQSHPADEVLSSAQNRVIGAATTRTHAEESASLIRIFNRRSTYWFNGLNESAALSQIAMHPSTVLGLSLPIADC
jgi:hypothetical protein